MFKHDAQEAVPLCDSILTLLLQQTATQGLTGATLRTSVGDFLANAQKLIQTDAYGQPLADIFDQARLAGVTLWQLDNVRRAAAALNAISIGAVLVKNTLIQLAMSTEGRIIADTMFVSRNDVELVQQRVNEAFGDMEETVADNMDAMTYRALIGLQAAITAHLIATAMPLPQMLNYQFNDTYSTLVVAYKLYTDAGRADQVLDENKIVHPAFCPRYGRALSA